MIKLINVDSGYPGMKIIDGVSTELEKGKLTVILGENGCGKTTLLSTVAGLIKNSAGKIGRAKKSRTGIGRILW